MTMTSGESPTPQFATAEYAPGSSALKCAACQGPIGGTYFQVKGAPVCAACAQTIRAKAPRDSHAAFVRAVVFGTAGALLGLALYVTFALTTGLVIGWVSLAVGFIVGKAMQMGSGGVGGRRYQVVAVLLTYFAVSISAVPIAIEQSGAHIIFPKAIAALALAGIASPFFDLRDPTYGLIGLVILFVGMRFAWRFTASRAVQVSGPYGAASAGSP
jgi:uncharacterized protein (DUF983 family)